jgi:hypothetical protein
MQYFKVLTFVMFILFFAEACKSYKQVTFDYYDTKNRYSYKLKIPKGYHFLNTNDFHANVDRYMYKDSSLLLMTCKEGGFRSDIKTKTYGNDIYLIMLSKDTIIGGLHKGNLYWKERKAGDFFISYYNVPLVKKAQFDSILNHISVSVSKISN